MLHLDPVDGGDEINKPTAAPGLHAPQDKP
jgi:hypothetical protein